MAKDLFADSTMSFGEHLEALRSHLFRCVVYLLVALVPAVFLSETVLDLVTAPILSALKQYDPDGATIHGGEGEGPTFREAMEEAFDWRSWWDEEPPGDDGPAGEEGPEDAAPATIPLTFRRDALRAAVGLPPDPGGEKYVTLPASGPGLGGGEVSDGLVSQNIQEPFVTYIKVCVVTAFVLASPLIFAELWIFVGAGLYPQERKYVYLYLPVSLFLFFAGAAFAYLVVFQFVLPFLLSFNQLLNTAPLLTVGPWLNFVLILPAMFGLSFQLPLVMLALNRLGVVAVEAYWTNVRFAILAIAGASMLLTPSDPGSMIAMMIPLTALYFVGIAMCNYFPRGTVENPFADEPERTKIEA